MSESIYILETIIDFDSLGDIDLEERIMYRYNQVVNPDSEGMLRIRVDWIPDDCDEETD